LLPTQTRHLNQNVNANNMLFIYPPKSQCNSMSREQVLREIEVLTNAVREFPDEQSRTRHVIAARICELIKLL
jgi:transposase-like protein